MERLVREVGQAVAQRILGNNESVDDVARELHEKLLLRNESTKKVVIESIYKDSDEARHNVEIFSRAPTLPEARPHLRKVGVIFLRHFFPKKKIFEPVPPFFLFPIRSTGPASRTNICRCGCSAREARTRTRRLSPRARQILDRRCRARSPRRRRRARSSRTLQRLGRQRRPACMVQPSSPLRSPWRATRRLLAACGRARKPAYTTMTMRKRRATGDKG
jgi:hypothetical protein